MYPQFPPGEATHYCIAKFILETYHIIGINPAWTKLDEM
jgi:hypothetical protein